VRGIEILRQLSSCHSVYAEGKQTKKKNRKKEKYKTKNPAFYFYLKQGTLLN
jgi:hypothetical protein